MNINSTIKHDYLFYSFFKIIEVIITYTLVKYESSYWLILIIKKKLLFFKLSGCKTHRHQIYQSYSGYSVYGGTGQ